MNMISQLRQQIQCMGSAVITPVMFDQLQAEWITRVGADTLVKAARDDRDDLLAALREIADDYADRFDMDSPSTNPGMKYVVQQARSAIAKATGSTVAVTYDKADAALVAAAPELLAALQALHDATAAYFQDFEHLHPIIRNRIAEAHAAIDKATGQG